MIHEDHLRKADESYIIDTENFKETKYLYFKDGEYIIFDSMDDLIRYVYFGEKINRSYMLEEDYKDVCKFNTIAQKANY